MKKTGLFFPSLIGFLSLLSCSGHSVHHDEDHDEETEMHDDHTHEGQLVIEEHEAERLGIITGTVTPGKFSEVVKTSGRIEAAPSDMITVSATRDGIFNLSNGISDGVSLQKGTLIGTLSSSGLQGGDPELAAHANLEAAKKELDRLAPLYQEGLVTASTFNEAQRIYNEAKALVAGNTKSAATSVSSPAEGILLDLLVSSGQYVEKGTPLAIISKGGRLTLRADLPSRYHSSAPLFKEANFSPEHSDSLFSVKKLDGMKVSGPDFSVAENGVMPLYFSIRNNGHIIPGSYAEVFLIGSPRDNVISLPLSAIVESQGNKYVYTVTDGHVFTKSIVKTGSNDGERIEIISGLQPDWTVVTNGASIVRMIETSSIAPPSHTHNH